jgi:thioredoxin-dependent adenylylsulfate APS reductase
MTAFTDLEKTSAEILAWTYHTHQRVALVASFQKESGVLIDMATRVVDVADVITLDTGRLPEETHEVMDAFRARYRIRLHVIAPDSDEVEAMTSEHGTRLFRESVALRQRCCDVRKARPLARALRDYDAWITGLRRGQTAQRASTPVAAEDAGHGGITKVAPLAAWSAQDVDRYLDQHQVPRHPLYARGYTSIGCAPCTRATAPGEDERAGRWWWERDGVKECGLHHSPTVTNVDLTNMTNEEATTLNTTKLNVTKLNTTKRNRSSSNAPLVQVQP